MSPADAHQTHRISTTAAPYACSPGFYRQGTVGARGTFSPNPLFARTDRPQLQTAGSGRSVGADWAVRPLQHPAGDLPRAVPPGGVGEEARRDYKRNALAVGT